MSTNHCPSCHCPGRPGRKLLEALKAVSDLADTPSRCHYISTAEISPSDCGAAYPIAHPGYAIKRRDWLDLVKKVRAAIATAQSQETSHE